MVRSLETDLDASPAIQPAAEGPAPARTTMYTPQAALRILQQRTGAELSRSSFYRWLASGRIYSVRMGYLIYIPEVALEDVIRQCLAGERV